VALALLEDAFDGDPPLAQLPLFDSVPETEVGVVRAMIRGRVNTPLAHGMGRYFDAFGALTLGRGTVSFEGQLALAFNVAADPGERGCYPWELTREGDVLVLDFRRAVRQVTFEVIGRAPAEVIAARFHNTIAAATADVVRAAARQHRGFPVVLTGGCFQNARLTEMLLRDLSQHLTVFTHHRVPPGDGGIALGQVAVAGLGR
jgi:hydrogenase maturation protein HypF